MFGKGRKLMRNFCVKYSNVIYEKKSCYAIYKVHDVDEIVKIQIKKKKNYYWKMWIKSVYKKRFSSYSFINQLFKIPLYIILYYNYKYIIYKINDNYFQIKLNVILASYNNIIQIQNLLQF